jgi:acyl-CoA reductase-like NAD-dependent aldehyde dehydrogenase
VIVVVSNVAASVKGAIQAVDRRAIAGQCTAPTHGAPILESGICSILALGSKGTSDASTLQFVRQALRARDEPFAASLLVRMTVASIENSSNNVPDAPSPPQTRGSDVAQIDQALAELRDRAGVFARLAPAEKAKLLRDVLPRAVEAAPKMVGLACQAKGIDPQSPLAGEEWFGGPVTIVNDVAALASAVQDIAKRGAPRLPFGSVRERDDGRIDVRVFPMRGSDARLLAGFTCDVRLAAGTQKRDVRAQQAAFYQRKDPEGAVSLVLGAGNVASIPAMDTLHELFVEGRVVILKMSPVNEYLAPVLNDMFSPLISQGFVRIVCGDGQIGAYLTEHEAVSHVHVTGSQHTHDRIVWGPPGIDQDKRRERNEPVLQKTITSELGNISPIIVVPFLYSEKELWFQARNIATQLVNNASFNCNAAKMLVLAKGWPQRDKFVAELARALGQIRPRKAYYPGALDRHATLTQGHEHVRKIGEAGPDELPWTLIEHLEVSRRDEPLFSTEPFCAILSEVSVGSNDPVEFLAAATTFCNDTLWGTLSASIVCHGVHEDDSVVGAALEKCIDELRYGAVAVNHWPAFVYGMVTAPWGGHPSSTLANVQSGKGFVHNTVMLGNIEKAILRGPLMSFPRPPLFFDQRKMHVVAERMMHYNANPGWMRLPSVATAAMTG